MQLDAYLKISLNSFLLVCVTLPLSSKAPVLLFNNQWITKGQRGGAAKYQEILRIYCIASSLVGFALFHDTPMTFEIKHNSFTFSSFFLFLCVCVSFSLSLCIYLVFLSFYLSPISPRLSSILKLFHFKLALTLTLRPHSPQNIHFFNLLYVKYFVNGDNWKHCSGF